MFSVKYVWEILNIKYWLDAFTTGLIRALTCYWMQSISKNKEIEEMITCSASSAEKISPVPFMLYSWPSSGKGFESLKFSWEICWFESVFLPGVLGVLTWESKPNLTLVACGPTLSIHSSFLTPDFCENRLSLITSHSHWWERIPTLAFGDGQTQDTAPRRFGTDSSHVCTESVGGGRAGRRGCTWELSERGTVGSRLCGFVLMRQWSASRSPEGGDKLV